MTLTKNERVLGLNFKRFILRCSLHDIEVMYQRYAAAARVCPFGGARSGVGPLYF